MSDNFQDFQLKIDDNSDSFFYSVYLAIEVQAPVVDRENIQTLFGETLFFDKSKYDSINKNTKKTNDLEIVNRVKAMQTKINIYRSYAFKPILDVLHQVGANQEIPEEEMQGLFANYQRLVQPQINKLVSKPSDKNNQTKDLITCETPEILKNNANIIAQLFEHYNSDIWVDEDDIYEFEKNFNERNDKNQIKILKRNNNGDIELFKNHDGDTFFPTGDPTFIVLQVFDENNPSNIISYKLIVTMINATKRNPTICTKYQLQKGVGSLCELPQKYKDSLLAYLASLQTSNQQKEESKQKLINHILNREPITPSVYASAEKIKEEIGSETTESSESKSVSNFSETSEHANQLFFNNLMQLKSFEASLENKQTVNPNLICEDKELKALLYDKTPNKPGLLGGSRKSRKMRVCGAVTKKTKKRKSIS